MSRAQQVQASRALIQNQMAATARGRGPLGPPVPGFMTGQVVPGEPARPGPIDPVLAGMPLRRVAIENLGSPTAGVVPAELPPTGSEVASLLSSDRLSSDRLSSDRLAGDPTDPDPSDPDPSGSVPPPEGVRIRNAIGQRHGVDLANVPVDRSAEGASEAYRMRARAFTSDRGIVIPAQVGSLDSGPGEALLGHELTHIAQRVRYGPTLPAESTPAGRSLEADALATEMTLHSGISTPSPPLPPPGEPRRPSWTGLLGGRSVGGETGQPLPLAAPAPSGPDPDSLAASILERVSALTTPASAQGTSEVFTPASFSMGPTVSAPAMTGGGIQRAEEIAPPVAAAAPAPPEAKPGDQGHAAMPRPSNEDLTNLSRWLYPLIRYRLKGELREDRERAGLLTDHYRRW
jgi:hypothetical protein